MGCMKKKSLCNQDSNYEGKNVEYKFLTKVSVTMYNKNEI